MEEIIQLLIGVANELDDAGHKKLADRVDAVSQDVLDIKTAQYVGVQGYWVRNTRCWQNCYRQKRASSPDRATWEIWADCHREYIDSINDDEADWGKYASSTNSLIKSAEVRDELVYKPYSETLRKKIKNGIPLGNAVIQSVAEQSSKIENDMLRVANTLVDLGSEARKIDNELGEILLRSANRVLNEYEEVSGLGKEAQFRDFFRGLGQGLTNPNDPNKAAKNSINQLGNAIEDFNRSVPAAAQAVLDNKAETKNLQKQLLETYRGSRESIINAAQPFSQMPNFSPQDLAQQLPEQVNSMQEITGAYQNMKSNYQNMITQMGLQSQYGINSQQPQQGGPQQQQGAAAPAQSTQQSGALVPGGALAEFQDLVSTGQEPETAFQSVRSRLSEEWNSLQDAAAEAGVDLGQAVGQSATEQTTTPPKPQPGVPIPGTQQGAINSPDLSGAEIGGVQSNPTPMGPQMTTGPQVNPNPNAWKKAPQGRDDKGRLQPRTNPFGTFGN